MYIFLKLIKSEGENKITVYKTRRVLHSSTSRSRHVHNILLYFQLSIQADVMFVEVYKVMFFRFLAWQPPPSGPGPSHSRRFYITHNDVPQSVGLLWTIDQLVYLTTYPHSRQTSMPPVGFEPTISAGEWPQTHATAYKVLFVRTATSQKSSDRYFR